jgi:hypothetical protein
MTTTQQGAATPDDGTPTAKPRLEGTATSTRGAAAPGRPVRSRLLLILLVAAVVRVLLLAHNLSVHPDFLIHHAAGIRAAITDPSRPYLNDFGFEASNIAYALVCTDQGFASPFGGSTGPTAWIAPGVVAPYAAAFALGGCFTFESILFAFAVALVLSMVTAVVVFRIGTRVGGDPSTGLLAALFFALLPFDAWVFHIAGQLDFNVQVWWFAVLLLAVLRTVDTHRTRRSVELGLVSSAAILSYPGFILCTAAAIPFLAGGRSRREVAQLLVILGAIHCAVVGPYVVWQSARLGGFVPVKSNGGFEIALGNSAAAGPALNQPLFESSHPSQNVSEFERYRRLGEMEYVRTAFRSFLHETTWQDFLAATARRCRLFFTGYEIKPWDASPWAVGLKAALWLLPALSLAALLAIRRGRLGRLETLTLLFTLAYAFPYLLTGIMERYRVPMVTTVALYLALTVTEMRPRARRKLSGPRETPDEKDRAAHRTDSSAT